MKPTAGLLILLSAVSLNLFPALAAPAISSAVTTVTGLAPVPEATVTTYSTQFPTPPVISSAAISTVTTLAPLVTTSAFAGQPPIGTGSAFTLTIPIPPIVTLTLVIPLPGPTASTFVGGGGSGATITTITSLPAGTASPTIFTEVPGATITTAVFGSTVTV
ncbi:hypothetical protein MD484_g8735, partial [Candolleomyces efflorescens]